VWCAAVACGYSQIPQRFEMRRHEACKGNKLFLVLGGKVTNILIC